MKKHIVIKKLPKILCSNQPQWIYYFETKSDAMEFIAQRQNDTFKCKNEFCSNCNGIKFAFEYAKIKKIVEP